MLPSILPSQDYKENASHDVKSSIPIEEKIYYITEQIYFHEKLTSICLKLVFRKFLIKLATEYTFKLNSRIFKEVGGIERPLYVTFSEIYMMKMENDVVIP